MDQTYFVTPFGSIGDQTPIPIPIDPSGNVSLQQGWGPDYQRDQETDPLAKDIDRANTNWLFFVITQAIAAIQQTGIPQWITPANNNGVAFPYAKYATVRYSATVPGVTFETYVSTKDNNTSVPGANTDWQPIASIVAANADVVAGTSTRLIVTPASLTAYPGNAGQTFLTADATSAQHAVPLHQVNAIVQASGTIIGGSRNLRCTHSSALPTANWLADEFEVGTALGGVKHIIANLNVTGTTGSIGLNGYDVGTPPLGGYTATYVVYNPTTGVVGTYSTNATAAAAPETYSGSVPLAGFTFSALLSILPNSASTGFMETFVQVGRSVAVNSASILSASVGGTNVPFTSARIPRNAKRVRGTMSYTITVAATVNFFLECVADNVDQSFLGFTQGAAGAWGQGGVFDCLMVTQQQLFFTVTASGGAPVFGATLSRYWF